MIEVSLDAVEQLLEGALAIRRTDAGVQPVRLTDHTIDHVHPSLGTPFTAEATNGIRLRFRTSARLLELVASPVISDRIAFASRSGRMTPPTYDLLVDGRLHQRRVASLDVNIHRIRFDGLPGTPIIGEVWLPHNVGVVLSRFAADDHITAAPDPRPRWVVHGSSITHDALAPGPSETWPAILAREANWHLTALGFRGDCHLDPFVARAIADIPADILTLELGINVHNAQSMRRRTFVPAVHGFLQGVRDGHPRVPLHVVSPIYSTEREGAVTSESLDGGEIVGDLSIRMMREILREAVEQRTRYGDESVEYVDGLSLIGRAEAGLLFDGLHPDGEGARLLGSRLLARLVTG